ncbi:hypothetical protein BCR42DRAFT_443372 [Absidia repens]|uniref:Uncharacterized protein n=1 Tax=Absidia repens TaxID=90262 RepID=A0A1X2I071_9FUNG|nr:hypothetical protein BCR42DRAFT_443372 [Absidia repens]
MISQVLIGKVYPTKDSMVKDVRAFARRNGFAITGNPGSNGCSQRGSGCGRMTASSRKTTTFKTATESCLWKAYGKTDNKETGEWKIVRVHSHNKVKVDAKNQHLIERQSIIEHSHEMISSSIATSFIFPSARKMDDSTKQKVISMSSSGIEPAKIIDTLAVDDIVIKDKDVYNIKQRYVRPNLNGMNKDERFSEQIKAMREQGFVISLKQDSDDVVRMMMITNPDAVEMTRQYGVVVSADSTYQTSDLLLQALLIWHHLSQNVHRCNYQHGQRSHHQL